MAHDALSQIDWDQYAINYDSLLSLNPYTQMLAEVIQALQRGPLGTVLDAGCGTGNLVLRLGAVGTTKITGMDYSPQMLMRAQQKCGGIQFVRAQLDGPLPFFDGAFDAVACVNALYAVEDPERTLAELVRITAARGTITIVTPKRGYENGLILKAHCGSTKPDDYWRGMHSDLTREELLLQEALQDEDVLRQLRMVLEVNRRISQNARFHFLTEPELRAIVQRVGLSIVDYRETYARQSHLLVARA